MAQPLGQPLEPVYCSIAKKPGLCMAGESACTVGRSAARPPRTALPRHGSEARSDITKSCLCMAGDVSCATGREYEIGIPNESLSLYKTISYVTGATVTDQLWYLAIASEAATTGGVFFVVNATTSSLMTYNYEYFWNLCCRAPPDEDGIVPVSATKAIIYRGLSIIRVGALALIFGNTLPSAALVTFAITVSRTAVYVTNDYVWNRIDVKKRTGPPATEDMIVVPPIAQLSIRPRA
ncbi:MAG: hypothetical protein HN478_07850 [Rhodospirillaceae bacterium]|nr:hypothetical protein [Rhodospirillaceae bacterium]MBT5050097.1 hypothetical protein [Rhodospirillaceae bacterium]MBT5898894.1 hypothetical protein [Rhodospirillaceae bacterium]MBT6430063.1 hypothetical protein [Rhodospirillaceae bacterium]MBT7758255.1 hypothetical protein [Rhodospirillaceae bacterium]